MRWAVLVALVTSGWISGQEVPAQGSKPLSPFDLAASIDSGTTDWDALWKELGLTGDRPVVPRGCDSRYPRCSTELIRVQNPSQVILLVQMDEAPDEYLFRFLREGEGWKFSGYFVALQKYVRRWHQTVRVGNKPFLKISVTGEAGTGILSEVEEWFDLSLPEFEPVFSFPVQGHRSLSDVDISRTLSGVAMPIRGSTVERIDVELIVEFSFAGKGLGTRRFLGSYKRPRGAAEFSLQRAVVLRGDSDLATQIANQDFEDLTVMSGGPSVEKLLYYAMPGLEGIASGTDEGVKAKLKMYLEGCRDTPERRRLERLLRRAATRTRWR